MNWTEIKLPLLNANEPEAIVAEVHAADGQWVEAGEILFTVETTKAATDIEAPAEGYFRLLVEEGETYPVGRLLAVLTPEADTPLDGLSAGDAAGGDESAAADRALRITRPARALAESLGLDLASLPADRLITEAVVREWAQAQSGQIALPPDERPYIVLFGAGGHTRAIIDLLRVRGDYAIAGVLDDNPATHGGEVLGVPVLGGRALIPALLSSGVTRVANGVGGILNIEIRVRIFELLLKAGFEVPPLVDARAVVEPSAEVGAGVQIFPQAYVGSAVALADMCMINTGAIVSHDCRIGRYTHIAPGAMLAGGVTVGERTLVGMGVTTAIGVHIGDRVRIGNGATILADVPDRTMVPAGTVWRG